MSLMAKLFVGEFMATGLIILMVNANFHNDEFFRGLFFFAEWIGAGANEYIRSLPSTKHPSTGIWVLGKICYCRF